MSEFLRRVRMFPIRHHSPGSSLLLEREIESRPPRRILVEGPADATPLIPALLDPGTIPPVALLAFRFEDGSKSAVYPFARYSPEYVALKTAARLGIPARFIDIPTSAAMALGDESPERTEGRSWAGFRSFDEFWEATFESGEASVDLLLDFARRVRQRDELDRVREAHMAREIEKELEVSPEEILVVCGAFHAAALMDDDVDRACSVPEGPASEVTIVPTSFARMTEQAGYGAGNRAPLFYQRVFDANGDFRRASLATLIDLEGRLRSAGSAVGLADTIEAYRLAGTLGNLREKRAPGVEEVREAAVACLLRGAANGAVQDVLVGDQVGRVSAKAARNPLREEFLAEVHRHGLPLADAPREVRLRLGRTPEIGTSVFLHRSRIARIPFAELLSATNARERWKVRWSPAVDRALGECLRVGDNLERVCERRILDGIRGAGSVGKAAEHLLEIVGADMGRVLAKALGHCRDLSVLDGDLCSLARAGRTFRDLVTLGSTRNVPLDDVMTLLRHVYIRALSGLPSGAAVADEGVGRVCTALKILADLSGVDPDLFTRAARALVDDARAHPVVCGLALALLRDRESLLVHLSRRLSRGNSPLEGARFVEGLLSVHRHVFVRDRTVVGALDQFLQALEEKAFREVLPVLRRAFAGMSESEVRYLLESRRGEGPSHAIRSRLEAALGVGLKAARQDLEELAAQTKGRMGAWIRTGTVESIAQAIREIDLLRLRRWEPERTGPPFIDEPPRIERFEDLRKETDRYRFARAVMGYCSHASLAELRRSQSRLWSDAEAGPFVVAALRARPEVAVDLAARAGSNPIAGRTAVALCRDTEEALRRLIAGRPPVGPWAEEALMRRSSTALHDAYVRRREAKRELHAERIKTALWARSSQDRAAAVSDLGQTRDPLFVPMLREASEDVSASVRDEAAVALARVGDDDDLETWIRDRRWRALGQLREARGLAALAAAAAEGAPGAIAALKEAGEEAIDAVLDRNPAPLRLLSLWDARTIEERRRRRKEP